MRGQVEIKATKNCPQMPEGDCLISSVTFFAVNAQKMRNLNPIGNDRSKCRDLICAQTGPTSL